MAEPLLNSDFWRGKHVLLTGHTGFKGSWLGLWLSELGAKVTGIALEPSTHKNLYDQLELKALLQGHHIADIRDVQTLKAIAEATQPDVKFAVSTIRRALVTTTRC